MVVADMLERGHFGKAFLGFLFSFVGALANGTFPALFRMADVRHSRVDPLVFSLWTGVGFVLASVVELLFVHFKFTPYGILSGLFFSLSITNAFQAVSKLGVAVSAGIWTATTLLTALASNMVLEGTDYVTHAGFGIAGAVLLFFALIGVLATGHSAEVAAPEGEDQPLIGTPDTRSTANRFANGAISAIVAGIFGGLIMMPGRHLHHDMKGLAFLPSLAIGVLITLPLIVAIPFVVSQEYPTFKREAVLPGITSGILFEIALVAYLLSVRNVHLAIAYPVFHGAVLVSGLWGILVFEELRGNFSGVFWLVALAIVAGAFFVISGIL